MKKIIFLLCLILLLGCKKNAFKDIIDSKAVQKTIPQEEIIFKNNLDILKKIDEYIIEKNYSKASELLDDIDINMYKGGLYSLLRNEEISTEEKIRLIKYITKGKLSNPIVLFYLSPKEYDIFVSEFSIMLDDPIDEFNRTILHKAVSINSTELLDYL